MVHSFFFSRIFSLTNSSHSEKQMVTVKSMTSTSEMRSSFDDDGGDEDDEESHCESNENPLKRCGGGGRTSSEVEVDAYSRWSSSCPVTNGNCSQWRWIAPDESESCSSFSYCEWGGPDRRKRRLWLTLGVASVILVTFVTILVVLLCSPESFGGGGAGGGVRTTPEDGDLIVFNIDNDTLRQSGSESDTGIISDSDNSAFIDSDNVSEGSDEVSVNVPTTNTRKSGLDMKQVSRLSWNLLNSNNDNNNHASRNQMRNTVATVPETDPDTIIENEGEIILPAKMVYTSTGDSQQHQTLSAVDLASGGGGLGSAGATSAGDNSKRKRSCCRTQKYSQVVKRDGCDPVTIVNKMCFGQCVSVWVPGLFASFPVCRPSRSHWKVVTLKCGPDRNKRKRVRIERVRRCSCMEIEPTTSDVTMHLS